MTRQDCLINVSIPMQQRPFATPLGADTHVDPNRPEKKRYLVSGLVWSDLNLILSDLILLKQNHTKVTK